jgi:hypothetical protein
MIDSAASSTNTDTPPDLPGRYFRHLQRHNTDGTYQLFRIGDAVNNRNVHAAVYDAFRFCLAT